MKTLTEFFGPHLLRALELRGELIAAGKTAEELPAALGEALKIEGDKLQRLLVALEIAEKKKDRLKRIVVLQPAEGQKAPAGAQERDGLVYVAEFFPAPAGSAPQKKPDGDERGRGGRGGRGDRKDRGRRGSGRPGRPGRNAEGGEGASVGPQRPEGTGSQEGRTGDDPARRRRRRGPRGPRPETAAANAEPLKAPTPRPASAKAAPAPEGTGEAT